MRGLPAGPDGRASYEGHPWSVPVNIHRSNMLWYRPDKLAAVGPPEPPATGMSFLRWRRRLEAGIPAMAIGARPDGTAAHDSRPFSSRTIGADAWRRTVRRHAGWDDRRVTKALEILNRVYDYHPARLPEQANE